MEVLNLVEPGGDGAQMVVKLNKGLGLGTTARRRKGSVSWVGPANRRCRQRALAAMAATPSTEPRAVVGMPNRADMATTANAIMVLIYPIARFRFYRCTEI